MTPTPQITESKHGADFDVSTGGAIVGHIVDMRPIACRAPFHASAARPGRPVIGLFESIDAAAAAIVEAHRERGK